MNATVGRMVVAGRMDDRASGVASSTTRAMRKHVVLIQLSDFGMGRGLYLSQALGTRFDVSAVTNRAVYGHGEDVRFEEESNVRLVQFDIPFAQALYRSVAGRLLVYGMFCFIAFTRAIKLKGQVLYSRGPHPFTEVVCVLYRVFNRDVKIISDTTDLWPDSLEYTPMNGVLKSVLIRLGTAVNRFVYRRVDAIVTHVEGEGRVLMSRYSKPTFVVPGAVDLNQFGAIGKEDALGKLDPSLKLRLDGKFVVMHAGLLGPFQQPSQIVDLAKKLDDTFCVLVVGTGPSEVEMRRRATDLGLSNIVFMGAQPSSAMPRLYGVADAFLLTYAPISMLRLGLPKKFIEYSASGRPIICVCLPCAASQLCLSAKAGFIVNPGDVEDLASKVFLLKADGKLRESMGRGARRLAEETFSVDAAARTLARIVDS
jgi:colanic acid biosynthesis glycosyl transferase WcaI